MAAIAGGAIDRSAAITTGGTAQTLMAQNSGRQYLFIQNISVENVWINFGVTAVQDSPSIRLIPGAVFEMGADNGRVFTSLVSVIAATTGSKIVAKEG